MTLHGDEFSKERTVARNSDGTYSANGEGFPKLEDKITGIQLKGEENFGTMIDFLGTSGKPILTYGISDYTKDKSPPVRISD